MNEIETLLTNKKLWFYELMFVLCSIFVIGAIYFIKLGGFTAYNVSCVVSTGILIMAMIKYNTNMVLAQLGFVLSVACGVESYGGYEIASVYLMIALVGLFISVLRLAIMKRAGKLALPKRIPDRIESLIAYDEKSIKLTVFWRLISLTIAAGLLLQLTTNYIEANGYADLTITQDNYGWVLIDSMIITFPSISAIAFATNLRDALIVRLVYHMVYMYTLMMVFLSNPTELWSMYTFVVHTILLIVVAYSMYRDTLLNRGVADEIEW